MFLLEWVKKLTGLSAWAGTTTLVVGVLVAVGGIAGWLREDALNDCNVKWELQIAKRSAALKEQVANAEIAMKSLELRLAEALREAEVSKANETKALEKQRENTPQTADCAKCRIPNERIWLRRNQTGRANSSDSGS